MQKKGDCGYTMQSYGHQPVITICSNGGSSCGSPCTTLIHELIHARQICDAMNQYKWYEFRDWYNDPDNCIRSEYEAYDGSDDPSCKGLTGVQRSSCLCKLACNSCADDWFGKDWDACNKRCRKLYNIPWWITSGNGNGGNVFCVSTNGYPCPDKS